MKRTYVICCLTTYKTGVRFQTIDAVVSNRLKAVLLTLKYNMFKPKINDSIVESVSWSYMMI